MKSNFFTCHLGILIGLILIIQSYCSLSLKTESEIQKDKLKNKINLQKKDTAVNTVVLQTKDKAVNTIKAKNTAVNTIKIEAKNTAVNTIKAETKNTAVNTIKAKNTAVNTIKTEAVNTVKSENTIQNTLNAQLKTKGPSNKMLPMRNAVGQKMKKKSILTKFPMKVTRCDQIAFFPAKYITDFADFKLRAKGYFSLNAHSVTLFKDKDSKQLISHILWARVKKTPHHLNGGKGCITIDAGGSSADISVCFESKATATNLLKVIATFYRCRGGDNLKPLDKKLFKKLKQVCGKNGKIISGKKGKKFKMSLGARAGNKWDSNRMSYNHPEAIRVPGTPKPQKKKKAKK